MEVLQGCLTETEVERMNVELILQERPVSLVCFFNSNLEYILYYIRTCMYMHYTCIIYIIIVYIYAIVRDCVYINIHQSF